ncbi:hypothetical protein, partial [Galbibacter mesophilus]
NGTTGALDVDGTAINGDGNITSTDLAVGGDSNALLGDVTLDIKDDAVTSDKIADGEVATADIADDAVTSDKISNGSANQILATNTAGDGVEWRDQVASNVAIADTDVDGDGTDETNVAGAIAGMTKVTSKAARIFYPPSIAINASTPGTFTIDLHAQYEAQYGSPTASSTNAPAIPTYNSDELYYYVTYADPTVFGNGTNGGAQMTISADGELTYEIIASPSDYNSLINVVFVVK